MQNICTRRRRTITIGDFVYPIIIGLLILAIVFVGVLAGYSLREEVLDAAVTEGIITAIGYRQPYTTYMTVNKVLIPQRHSGYWWIDVYNDDVGRTRRIKVENPAIYQVGNYWRET